MSINLLPWRDVQRKQQIKKMTLGFISIVLISCMIIGGLEFYLKNIIHVLQTTIHQLKKSTSRNLQTTSTGISYKKLAQFNQTLQNSSQRNQKILTILMLLSQKLPKNMIIASIAIDKTIKITGTARNQLDLQELWHALNQDFSEVKLHEIQQAGKTWQFVINLPDTDHTDRYIEMTNRLNKELPF